MNDYFTFFYVKHFELPMCMKCAIQINLPCLALCGSWLQPKHTMVLAFGKYSFCFYIYCERTMLSFWKLYMYVNTMWINIRDRRIYRFTDIYFILFLVTYTIIQRIISSEMCSLHLTHPSAHTWSSGHGSLGRSSSTTTACNFIQDSLVWNTLNYINIYYRIIISPINI